MVTKQISFERIYKQSLFQLNVIWTETDAPIEAFAVNITR